MKSRTAQTRGFVPTPDEIVSLMVAKLFAGKHPSESSRILDPGCGQGAFIEGILCWCTRHSVAPPAVVGIESDPTRSKEAADRFASYPNVKILERDFLASSTEKFDYIIGNPPYVAISYLDEEEKARYRAGYVAAHGRFDLYLLFFEQALRLLKPGGRLVFITPEKFLYVESAAPLRRLLGKLRMLQIQLVAETTFAGLLTYPTITTLENLPPHGATEVVLRNGTLKEIAFPTDGSSLLPRLFEKDHGGNSGATLADFCLRISCGVATGADQVFVQDRASLDADMSSFAYETISGRQLSLWDNSLSPRESMLIPYHHDGKLIPLRELGSLGRYLSEPAQKQKLLGRACVKTKPWYAFHETPPMKDILRPKILCKDITSVPRFWVDRDGTIVPRHSVYYCVPNIPEHVEAMAEYLNSSVAIQWMRTNCQRASNGFIRLQSNSLKRLPMWGYRPHLARY